MISSASALSPCASCSSDGALPDLDSRSLTGQNRTTCASTVIAMHLESALSPGSTDTQRQLSRTSIHGGLAYLRACLPYWDSVRWSLRMLDVIVSKSRLSLTDPKPQTTSLSSSHGRPRETTTATNGTRSPASSSVVAPETTDSPPVPPESDPARTSLPFNFTSGAMEHGFSFEPISLDSDLDGDFNDILVPDFFAVDSMPAWAYGGVWNRHSSMLPQVL